uniref:Subtilisin-chymotrypsin inhibitor-2A n=5 Tax=Triticinae TaxID=1648030 RepID=A0A453B112_AEGTS
MLTTKHFIPCRRLPNFVSNMSKPCDGAKTEWPELVGRTIKEAEEKIKADRPDLKVVIVPVGSVVTQEVDLNRVRVWVDTVAEVPKIG